MKTYFIGERIVEFETDSLKRRKRGQHVTAIISDG